MSDLHKRIQVLQALAVRERAEQPHPNQVEALLLAEDAMHPCIDDRPIILSNVHNMSASSSKSSTCIEAEPQLAMLGLRRGAKPATEPVASVKPSAGEDDLISPS